MIDCSIIIPSLRPKSLDSCIASIYRTEGASFQILIDGANGGIYKNVDSLIAESCGEYILHIPDDVLVKPDTIANMIKFCADRFVLGSFRSFSRKWELEDGDSYYNDLLWSRFPFMKKSLIKNIGGFMDTSFNSFYGDPDLSLRVWSAGGSVETCHDAWIIGVNAEDKVHDESKKKYEAIDREVFKARWT